MLFSFGAGSSPAAGSAKGKKKTERSKQSELAGFSALKVVRKIISMDGVCSVHPSAVLGSWPGKAPCCPLTREVYLR